jgi:hypothetical protein
MIKIGQLLNIVNESIDDAFLNDNYNLNFYDYLCNYNIKRKDVLEFINSNVGISLVNQIEELECYLNDTNEIFSEAYQWMGKQKAIKLKNYFEKIIEDANRYEQFKRPGRKPKTANK